MKKRILCVLLAAAMMISLFAACSNNGNNSAVSGNSSSASESSASGASEDGEAVAANAAVGPDDTTEHVDAIMYYNFDWWTPPQWGSDAMSQYMEERFNVTLETQKPDFDADAKMNIMIASGDLPDIIMMNRGPDLKKLVDAGLLVNIEPLMYDGCPFAEEVSEATRDLLKINGGLYTVPNYSRKGATGGNEQWIVNTRIHEAVGSPDLSTLEGLHQYALAVKEANLTSWSGASIYPFIPGNTSNGQGFYVPIYRSLGMPGVFDSYFTQENGKIQFCIDSENFVEALRIANQWYNEGLVSVETFTDSNDTFMEKLTNGRVGLLWYDFSMDNGNNFRRMLRQFSDGADSYEVIGSEYFHPEWPLFPPAEGVEVTYGDEAQTVGYNVEVISSKTKNPQRLFDMLSWLLTPEGTICTMYGPEGTLWEGTDENGIPNLIKPQSEFTSDEMNAAGAWFWNLAVQSDNMDLIKFAVNDQDPVEARDWVMSIQGHTTSYNEENPTIGQKFLTDQTTALSDTIDPQEDAGVNRQMIYDAAGEMIPKIIMAESESEFNSLVENLRNQVHSNGIDEIVERYQAKYDENIATQGFDAYDPAYDVYKLNK